jgi:hypothetical protein
VTVTPLLYLVQPKTKEKIDGRRGQVTTVLIFQTPKSHGDTNQITQNGVGSDLQTSLEFRGISQTFIRRFKVLKPDTMFTGLLWQQPLLCAAEGGPLGTLERVKLSVVKVSQLQNLINVF